MPRLIWFIKESNKVNSYVLYRYRHHILHGHLRVNLIDLFVNYSCVDLNVNVPPCENHRICFLF